MPSMWPSPNRHFPSLPGTHGLGKLSLRSFPLLLEQVSEETGRHRRRPFRWSGCSLTAHHIHSPTHTHKRGRTPFQCLSSSTACHLRLTFKLIKNEAKHLWLHPCTKWERNRAREKEKEREREKELVCPFLASAHTYTYTHSVAHCLESGCRKNGPRGPHQRDWTSKMLHLYGSLNNRKRQIKFSAANPLRFHRCRFHFQNAPTIPFPSLAPRPPLAPWIRRIGIRFLVSVYVPNFCSHLPFEAFHWPLPIHTLPHRLDRFDFWSCVRTYSHTERENDRTTTLPARPAGRIKRM